MLRSPLPPVTQQDFSASFALAWDSERLYTYVAVRDDRLVMPDSDTRYFADDGVEIFVDMTPTSATSYSDDSGVQFFVNPPGVAVKSLAFINVPWTGSAGFAEDESAPIWYLEIGLDWPDAYRNLVQPGATFGFDVAANDDDSTGTPSGDDREGQLFWNDATGLAAQNPSLLGLITLDDCQLP